jgi:hypothetical protein
MKLGLFAGLAGAAMAGLLATARPSEAAVLTVDLDVYPTAQYSTPGVTLGVMTVRDIMRGVDVTFSLANGAQYFASTGGPHITVAVDLSVAVTKSDVTTINPTGTGAPTFTYTQPTGSISPSLGTFTFGFEGNWSGNNDGFYAVADILAPKPNGTTGDVGGKVATITTVPEPSTWAMMLLGFAGLAYAGYRKAKGPSLASSVA